AVAEMEKLLENTYRNINIGLANEMAIICNRMGNVYILLIYKIFLFLLAHFFIINLSFIFKPV
ncbi:MAG: hypothetical protein E6588_12455, partial [Acinetobacter sp.]|nr:hypothetical protein [Acinetobacter sp.]